MLAASAGAAVDETLIQQEYLRLQSEPDHAVTFEISAEQEFVFDFLTQRVHDYTTRADSVSFDHANSAIENNLGPGSLRITTMENSEQLVQRFLFYDPPNGYAYFTDMEKSTVDVPLSYSLARYELMRMDDERTRLRVSVVYQSSSRLLSFFVRRAFNSALENDFASAVELIEAEYP